MAIDSDDLDAIDASIAASALGPAEVEFDGERVKARTAKDMIDAATYLAGQVSTSQPGFGLRFSQIVPPGGGGTP